MRKLTSILSVINLGALVAAYLLLHTWIKKSDAEHAQIRSDLIETYSRLLEQSSERARQIETLQGQLDASTNQNARQAAELSKLQDDVSKIEPSDKLEARIEKNLSRGRIELSRLNVRSIQTQSLSVTDAQGAKKLSITSNDASTRLWIGSGEKSNSFQINVFADGRKAMLFRNEYGKNRIGLSTGADGEPRLRLHGGAIELTDDEYFKRILIGDEDASFLSVYDPVCGSDPIWELQELIPKTTPKEK